MRNGKLRGLLITVMLLVFLAGLASILYPYMGQFSGSRSGLRA